MTLNLEYPTIEKGCNGTFIFYEDRWHRLLEITGTVYNHYQEFIPAPDILIIPNDNWINNRLIITKKIFDLSWINDLSFSYTGACW